VVEVAAGAEALVLAGVEEMEVMAQVEDVGLVMRQYAKSRPFHSVRPILLVILLRLHDQRRP
jgi:hypothetical protein